MEKTSDNIQDLFMIKTLNKLNTEEMYIYIIKTIYDKPIANITLNSKSSKAFLLSRNKTRVLNLTTLTQHSIASPSHTQEKELKGRSKRLGKEEVKLSLLADDMIFYLENFKDTTKKLLNLNNEFSNGAECKINIQKSSVLYNNNTLYRGGNNIYK